MFTGLVEAVGTILKITKGADVTTLRVSAPFAGELKCGDSVAICGLCTTVVERNSACFSVELTDESMRVSRFSSLIAGEPVNLERALPVTGRLDGHLVAGHVDGTAVVLSLKKNRTTAVLTLNLPQNLMRYVVYKGSICVDGVSLTVASVEGNACSVAVIPETLARTTLGQMAAGKRVNIETDMIARYIEKFLGIVPEKSDGEKTAAPEPLTAERLARMGW